MRSPTGISTGRRGRVLALGCLALLMSLMFRAPRATSQAAGTDCRTGGPASGQYTVTVCLTAPLDGAVLTGAQTASASVTVTGTNPGVQKAVFYLDGQYLLTDYASGYTFVLPTDRFVDGSHALEAEADMRDGYVSDRAAISVTFNNGVTQPPTNTNTFTPSTGTIPSAGRPFILAATGDGASGEPNAGAVTDLIATWNANLFLYLGDVYENGTPTEFYNWYGMSNSFYSRFRAITDPAVGNHEYTNNQALGYFDYWDNVPNYYSFDVAGWHIISLNSTSQFNQTAPGTPQYDWLAQDLSANAAICTITYFHHPVFNVGSEGAATRMDDIWALLAQHDVDIVLTGHDHDYQRWYPLNGQGTLDPNGMTQFVVGTGGHGIQQFIQSDPRLAVGFDTPPTAFGALRLELNQDGAAYQFINSQGAMLDSGSMSCNGAPPDTTPPGAPSNLSATAPSSSQVNLTWTSATDNVGVTGYDIYRDGVFLTTTGPGASYTDRTVAPGITYSYQVRARDAADNVSDPSNIATVTTAAVLFRDGFESGNFSKWTTVNSLTLQQQEVFAGTYSARGTSTGAATYAYKQLDSEKSELYYRIRFKIISQGANTINLLKFRTGANASILGLYVTSTGRLGTRNDVAGTSNTSSTTVTLSVWHEAQLHALINGSASQIDVWLDGIPVDALSRTDSLGTALIGRIQLGENSTGRTYDVAFDQVVTDPSFIPPPSAENETVDVDANTSVTVNLAASTVDGDCPLIFGIVSQPSHGTLGGIINTQCAEGSASAQVTYLSNPNYNGEDTFTYLATAPGGVLSNIATVTVSVHGGSSPTPTPTPTNAATPTLTSTSMPTSTSTPTPTPTATSTLPPTPTSTPTNTATPTPSNTPTATPASTTFTFTPVADAYVDQSKAITNYGTRMTLRIDASPINRSYLRFNVQGLAGTITRATLRVFANNRSSVGYDVRGVSDNTWGELTITYDNAPPVGNVVGSYGAIIAGTWTSVDVTPLVTGEGLVSLALTTGNSSATNFASRESSANAPQLIIETAIPSATPTHTPSPTAIPPTATPIPTDTPAPTSTPTDTPTPTPTPTATPMPTDTLVPTSTPTDSPTPTDTPLPTDTPTSTPTPTET